MAEYDGYQKYKERPKTPDQIHTTDNEYTLEELQGMVYDTAAEILNGHWVSTAIMMKPAEMQEWICGKWNMVSKYNNLDGYENWNEWVSDIVVARLGMRR